MRNLLAMEQAKEKRIKEVSALTGLPESTVRYWEKEFAGHLCPSKTRGGQRRYSDSDVALILRLKELLHEERMTMDEAREAILKEKEGRNAGQGDIDWSKITLLVTGGTGSFGKFFCRYLLDRFKPRAIRVFSRDELKQYEMRMEFNDDKRLRFLIGDVRDGDRLRRAMQGVDFVVHAAALKQVPACEYNPFEAVKTNVYGAQNIIEAAIDSGVKKVVALSTDKAVNPVNLYGATKFCSDKLFIHGNSYSGTNNAIFSCVRYGNVIGSRGSVVPLFIKQRDSGKITITDPRMTRFWITLEAAANLVMQAFRYMEGGEIFVPRIPSMRILDLAEAIAPGCEIEHIGIRSGEKLHESLTGEDEARHTYRYHDMFVVMPGACKWWCRDDHDQLVKMPSDFVYTSDSNDNWLGVDDLRKIVFPSPGSKLFP